jgi:hypothetical protein
MDASLKSIIGKNMEKELPTGSASMNAPLAKK